MQKQFTFAWTKESLDQLNEIKKKRRASESEKFLNKLNRVLESIALNPFQGLGKPEPLKFNYPSCWSRRITLYDRIVYQVKKSTIIIITIIGHY